MVSATATAAREGDLLTVLRTYNDVTERLKRSHEALVAEVCRLREELQEKNRELQRRERLAALGEMAAGVAHEIRNPLGGIGLYASLLERDLLDRPKLADIARRIGAGVQSVEAIVRDILAFAGGAEPRLERIRLATILESVLTAVAPQAQKTKTQIHIDPRLARVDLSCDVGQIERAILNLVLNALDAAQQNGRVWIRLGELCAEEGRVSIAVEDNGPGIDPALRQRVFNPFFTTKERGTGLGLAIVHRIAEAHGGCVTVGQRREGGAALTLTLPLAGDTENDGNGRVAVGGPSL